MGDTYRPKEETMIYRATATKNKMTVFISAPNSSDAIKKAKKAFGRLRGDIQLTLITTPLIIDYLTSVGIVIK